MTAERYWMRVENFLKPNTVLVGFERRDHEH